MNKITLTVIILLFLALSAPAQNIVINEIMTSNTQTNTDEDGDHQDWVELYNNGATAVNLNGFGLTDDASAPFKWVFPNVTVNPGQYLLVWCSDKNRVNPSAPLHTNFKISSSGEQITLTSAANATVDVVPATVLEADYSYGRMPNGTGGFVLFQTATPNAQNTDGGFEGILSVPTFSQQGGFYTSAFNLTLSTTEPGATIIYTLDGSDPQEDAIGGATYPYKQQYPELSGQATGPILTQSYSTSQYSAPLNIADRTSQPNDISGISSTYSFNPDYYIPDSPVFKGTTVKARVVKPGYVPSPIVTKTYFVTPLGSARFSIPVISLSFPETSFFDYNEGIYVAGVDFDIWRLANPNLHPRGKEAGNYYRRGIENEKLANMSYFVNGQEVLNQQVGLRIRGASTRRYESKSLTVYARDEYGDGSLSYPFFSDLNHNSYKRLTLSNSGSDFRNTMFRDALGHEICKSLRCENENYQPTITFFNGEYWGLLNIRERYDDKYFERVYGFDDVDLLENQGIEAEEGDTDHYQSMINFISNNSLAVPANYDYVKTQLDPESFTDNWIANIYLDNSDWPGNNTQFWRKRVPTYDPTAPYGHDGRWRWVFHDMDDTFSYGTDDYAHNNLEVATTLSNSWPNPAWSTLIIRKLLENDSYKVDFISRFADLMNTIFKPTHVISKMNTLKNGIMPEIAEHISRWSIPSSVTSWNNHLTYQTNFANQRPAFQREHIRSKFGIANDINVTLNVSGASHGHIKINTIDIAATTDGVSANPYPWSGIYYSQIPVKLKAIAKPGYIFSHWTGASDSTEAEITITTSSDFSITAVFTQNEPIQNSEPIYFWMMNSSIPNDTPLTSLNSTYELLGDGVIAYQSCLEGYPFTSASPFWRKASMERRNAPTPINYRPEANNNQAYAAGNMRGLQILQPFQSGGLENTMVFNFSTATYKDIKFSFAAKDEGAASGITIDYSTVAGQPVWTTSGLASSSLALSNAYQLFEVDFSSIAAAANNPNFKIRLRFTGANMTVDNGDRVTFNNIALDGVKIPLVYPTPLNFTVGTAISVVSPTVSGGTVTSFSVSPALPAGLTLNTTNGQISGTPTTATAAATYTVTANYSGGNATFPIVITVGINSPSNLTYASPSVLTVGSAVTLSPTSTGGAPSSYGISPALPAGLSLNTATGVISGTPSAVTATSVYTITATNAAGSTTFALTLTVNDSAPSALSYPTPNTFTVNTSANLTPTVTGNVVNYSISPALPAGLSINAATGVISGTPTSISPATGYTVTASNSGGSTTAQLTITVNDSAPGSISYTSPNTFTAGIAISPMSPTLTGGSAINFSVSPSLPSGLSISATTGVISGTPSVPTPTTGYTVTAANSGGSTVFNVIITVNPSAPSNLSYATPNIFVAGSPISPLQPSVTGSVTNYSVSPSLPSGLSLNASTGVISGTPNSVSASGNYTVTASNNGGSTTFQINITVNDPAPTALSYTTPSIFTVGLPIEALSPSFSGNATFSISPSLPAGLSLNTATGIISGTPMTISAQQSYTVTATNSGGSTTFVLQITVNDAAPSSLSYASPNIFTVGSPISALNPSVSGGAVVNYSVSPSLPVGLSMNSATGVISGTPTAVSVSSTYLITATNSGGSTTFNISIAVNDAAPSGLSYNSPNVFVVGTAITPLSPTISGSGYTFTVSPSLVAGLSINASSGVISGTPSVVSSAAAYTVSATNTGGTTSFEVIITVNDVAPQNLSYPTPNVFVKNTPIQLLSPTVSGGAVTDFSISPSLPAGLSFNQSTGVISGTPSVVLAATNYTVTAHNSGGSATFVLSIAINDIAPAGLSYTSPNVFTIGNTIAVLSPSVSGGTVTAYSASPALPAGLSLNSNTGIISGTPTVVSALASYTITASNSGGQTSASLQITVNDIAPESLAYASPNIFSVGTPISPLAPSVGGGAVVSYQVSPSLPAGLSINSSGVISGTPTTVTPLSVFTVTASNSGGITSFAIEITVKDIAPAGLSYASPNTFTIGTPITPLVPTVSGGATTTFSVSPALASGLSLNASTGVISGTPTSISPMTPYTVTASNSGGSTSFAVSIRVNDLAPQDLTYVSPAVLTIGSPVSITPTVSGGSVTTYSVSPSLPAGLSINAVTGVISGTPQGISPTGTYTITATNSGGTSVFVISITVNDIAPSSLSYPTPNIFYINAPVTTLFPTVSGNVISFTISPSLPAGLNFDAQNGAISGTPVALSPQQQYTVTATNSGGSTSFGLAITITQIAPAALSYPTPNVFTVNAMISSLNPVVTGEVSTYSIAPALPAGLSLNAATGVISGTPTEISAAANYTVTASNDGGSVSFVLSIAVNDIAPDSLSYPTPINFTVNVPVTPVVPTVSGNVTYYTIFPPLPSGLNFDTATGIISGNPDIITPVTNHTVTAFNSGGSISFDILVKVNDVAPTGLNYNSPNIFNVGSAITPLQPTVSGTVINYTVMPALPPGLSLNVTTGVISGTPVVVSGQTGYTVSANNSGGSSVFNVLITVNPQAPSALSYQTPNVFTAGSEITALSPTVTGTVTAYSVSPELPQGMAFNTQTGVISGTPLMASAETIFTVTASNAGGNTSFDVSITVVDAAAAISYPDSNIFTVGQAITPLSPTIDGIATDFTVVPELPAGLSIDSATGVISGTPTVVTVPTSYLVTAQNTGGSASANLFITVNDIAPTLLSYPTPNVFTAGTMISPLMPTVTGNVNSYSITPELPAGLAFETSTGMISGTPLTHGGAQIYTVMAVNSGGNTTFDLSIAISMAAPSELSYNSPNIFTLGEAIAPLLPTVTGEVDGYSVQPALPQGLSIDSQTGVISGTPTNIAATGVYTVTASNGGGFVSFNVVISVVHQAPTSLSYTNPNVFEANTSIVSLTPTVNGAVSEFTVSPSLPTGLVLDSVTGVISGTPIVVIPETVFTVTATNPAGSVSFDLLITVEEQLGLDQSIFAGLQVYPNPFNDEINVSLSASGVTYDIYSVDGKRITSGDLISGRITLRELPSGMYMLMLNYQGETAIKKIIKN